MNHPNTHLRWIGIPPGLRDELGAEAARRDTLERQVLDALTASGYTRIATPVLEYYDLFIHAGLPLPQEAMLKLEDRSGRLCVMRPDSTIPAARVAATKLRGDPMPLKLCYAQPVFRVQSDGGPSSAGRVEKYSQAGIETIGSAENTGSADADAEILRLLLDTLYGLGLTTLHVEIGHAGLIRTLTGTLGLGPGGDAELLAAFERRNFARMRDILALAPNRREADTLERLSMLSGIRDCGEAMALIDHPEAREMLAGLNALSVRFRDESITLDGSMVSRMDYYTGLIFRVYTPGAARSVAVGGRYDRLMERFGIHAPAIGFVLDLDAIAELEESP
ncbi:MAG: ATP phosphoribosyltransferase regulatory subunit [Oscillospiraceae bacterium]|nr:ATP phosphoribosyltransferase regulatory subunit [Oscillospiraceae bacterium]